MVIPAGQFVINFWKMGNDLIAQFNYGKAHKIFEAIFTYSHPLSRPRKQMGINGCLPSGVIQIKIYHPYGESTT
jgi:hypothetical protein